MPHFLREDERERFRDKRKVRLAKRKLEAHCRSAGNEALDL